MGHTITCSSLSRMTRPKPQGIYPTTGVESVPYACHNQTHKDANDPSAGSPTETLLRLLLPLSDKVHYIF